MLLSAVTRKNEIKGKTNITQVDWGIDRRDIYRDLMD